VGESAGPHDHTRVILSDFGVVIDIPEADPRPYVTLDAALLMHDRHMQTSRSAPVYKTDRPIIFAESMCVLQMLDGTESLRLYFQNFDMLQSTQKGRVSVYQQRHGPGIYPDMLQPTTACCLACPGQPGSLTVAYKTVTDDPPNLDSNLGPNFNFGGQIWSKSR